MLLATIASLFHHQRPTMISMTVRRADGRAVLLPLTLTAYIASTRAKPAGSSKPRETPAPIDPAIDRKTRRQDRCGDRHHHGRTSAGIRQYIGRLPQTYPDRARPVDSVRGLALLSDLFQFWRRGAVLMDKISGMHAPLHRALPSAICLPSHDRWSDHDQINLALMAIATA